MTSSVPKNKRCRSIKTNATCHSFPIQYSSSVLPTPSNDWLPSPEPPSPCLLTKLWYLQVPGSLTQIQFPYKGTTFPSITMQPRVPGFRVKHAAKPDNVEKVCNIVKKQLALPEDSGITGESKIAALRTNSLNTVEIVMGLEEEFGINVEEENAQSITTVQEAADMIEELLKTTEKTEKSA